MSGNELIKVDDIRSRIFTIRGMQVMLDSDLAELYGVETKNLNLAVKRNIERFPNTFRFQLAEEEYKVLRLQIETSNEKRGGRRYAPFVFTEQGVAMLSAVLRSETAVDVITVRFLKHTNLSQILSVLRRNQSFSLTIMLMTPFSLFFQNGNKELRSKFSLKTFQNRFNSTRRNSMNSSHRQK